jgi:hypothetical protein
MNTAVTAPGGQRLQPRENVGKACRTSSTSMRLKLPTESHDEQIRPAPPLARFRPQWPNCSPHWLDFEIDELWDGRQNCCMGEAERPTCPKCGAPLVLALPPDGKGERRMQCLDCSRPDPMKSPEATGWLNSELQPPK